MFLQKLLIAQKKKRPVLVIKNLNQKDRTLLNILQRSGIVLNYIDNLSNATFIYLNYNANAPLIKNLTSISSGSRRQFISKTALKAKLYNNPTSVYGIHTVRGFTINSYGKSPVTGGQVDWKIN